MNKNKFLTLVIGLMAFGLTAYLSNRLAGTKEEAHSYRQLAGTVFHTVYHIQYDDTANLQPEIDRLFREFDGSMSMFNDTSLITRFNRNDTTVRADKYFREIFTKGQYVSSVTGGAFDMTVAPLVNLWGFGFTTDPTEVTPQRVDSCLSLVGIDKVQLLDDGRFIKENPGTIMDASSIAKGYSCDMVAEYLQSRGIKNYMVEVGGEIALRGVNQRGLPWSIGISRPIIDSLGLNQGDFQEILRLSEGGVATSGNYRNFKKDGKKMWGHTIDPHTGYPIQQDVLSSTVIAADCMTADAFATAFMVLGSEKAREVLNKDTTIMAYLIIGNVGSKTEDYTFYCSPRLQQMIDQAKKEAVQN